MMVHKRIRQYAPADYREGTELDFLIKTIIQQTAAREKLERAYVKQMKESYEKDSIQ